MSYLFNDKRFEANQTNYALRAPAPLGSDVGILSGFSPTNAFKTTVEGLHQGIVNEPLTALSLAASSVIDVAAHALKVKYHIDRPDLVQSIKDSWFKHTTEPLIKDRIQSMPDPKTNGIAIQVLHSLASIGGQAATMGAAATGVASGIGEAATMVQQGKDSGTALKVGAIRGATNAVGVKIPAAVGSNLAQRVASGAAGNVAIGAASDAAINTVDSTIGARFDDPTNRTIDLVLGAAFGGLAHVQAKANVKTDGINTEQSDAALVANNSRKVNNTSEPERLYKAIDDLTIPKENNNAERTIDNTEPVSDTLIIPDSERTTAANQAANQVDGERANQFTTPEIEAASEIIQKDNSMEIAVEDGDGNIVIKPAAELADEINADIEFASKSDSLIKTAITCFLK